MPAVSVMRSAVREYFSVGAADFWEISEVFSSTVPFPAAILSQAQKHQTQGQGNRQAQAMPAALYNQGGDPAWGNWKGTATQSSSSAATPWPSSAPAAASGMQAASPWAAALPQLNTAAAGLQQAAVGVSSIV